MDTVLVLNLSPDATDCVVGVFKQIDINIPSRVMEKQPLHIAITPSVPPAILIFLFHSMFPGIDDPAHHAFIVFGIVLLWNLLLVIIHNSKDKIFPPTSKI